MLYITYDGLTDPLGQSQVLPYLVQLSKSGFHFTILSFEKPDRLIKEKKIITAITEKAGIRWVPLSFTKRPPIISKIYDKLRMQSKAEKLQKQNHFDLVHCRSYVAAETGLKLKKKFGVKMLFDMRGFWADEKVDNGQWNLKKPFYKKIYRHYKKQESEFLLQADGIVSLTEASKKILVKQARIPVDVIPCCADLERFDYSKISEQEKKTLRASLNMPENSKLLTYVGSIGGWYLTKEMFRFFKLLNQQFPEYKMLVLSKDSKEKIRAEMIQAGIPEDKFWIDYANRDELPRYLSLSSCGIFFIKNSYSKIASSPTKHAELMGMGIPVICNDIGDTGTIVEATNTGYIINDFSETSFNAAIQKIKELENINKESIRNAAKRIFDLEIGVKKYLSVYQKMISQN